MVSGPETGVGVRSTPDFGVKAPIFLSGPLKYSISPLFSTYFSSAGPPSRGRMSGLAPRFALQIPIFCPVGISVARPTAAFPSGPGSRCPPSFRGS
ncbi:hypothetical protein FA13DRAFT_352115 [Coprinellus micaceus]|uniref:Uncharacterized protein n=1 Tax=Coprinellus micaceus TaxID=71717 RepID=A0A4Y7TCE1_COPMI|nr:hypothetical protein FA13DRAFT_352115 [Coprinellus micaceus]